MRIDIFEPLEIEAMIKQALPDSERLSLNAAGFADYLWYTVDGFAEQAERKQCTEILSGMEHVEYQLGKHLDDVPNLFNMILLIEGVAVPVQDGTQTYLLHKNGQYFRKSRHFKIPFARYEGWIMAQQRAGILVWRTSSWLHTAEALIRFQKSAESKVHTALNRHLKENRTFHRNPYVEKLMGLKGAELGPEKAEALIDIFGTPWDVYRQPAAVIAEYTPGVGLSTAEAILTAVGRGVS